MAYNEMGFKRTSNGYNAENGDYLDFDPTSTLSFGGLYRCTNFSVSIVGGITSATTSGRTHEMGLQLRFGSNWREVWSGEKYLPAKGSTGYEISFSGVIPEPYQTEAAINGVTDIRLQQKGSYALRGANASGTVGITYELYVTNCGAPTVVTINGSSSQVTTGDATATLAWSGAYGGTNNSIAGYVVLYREKTGNGSWSDWFSYGSTDISSTSSSGSLSVNLGGLGTYRQFKIGTFGTAGKDYMSGYKESPVVARSYTACGAPTACAVDSTLSLVATMLRWSGATDGYGNQISKYEVQRRSKAPGGAWSAWSALETTSGTSLSVSPPATAGHYYQYRVRAQGTAGEAYYSSWKESTNTLRKAHQTIPAFTDPTLIVGQTDVKAVHITELQSVMNDILLPFMGVSKVTFTELERDSDAKHWGDHVQEIKAAIDSTGFSHEAWVTMQDEVTADVIEQLRRIVKSM